MSRRALNVSMPSELADYVAGLVASGRYGTASDLVRAGLRLLQDKEAVPANQPTARMGKEVGFVER